MEGTKDPIDRFVGEYAWLSNFYPSPLTLEILGTADWYPTVEHAFQAAKCIHFIDANAIRAATSPGQAKAMGRRVQLRSDWEQVKVGIMREIVAAKFASGSELAKRLQATGDRPLIEGNHWGDRFWGCTRPTSNLHSNEWVGLNWLGELLMRQREALLGR